MKRLLIILLLLTACGNEVTVSTLPDPVPDQKMNATEKGVSLTLTEVVFSESPAVIQTIVKNESTTDYRYGEFYHIELKIDGLWHIITYSDAVFLKNSRFKDTGSTLAAGDQVQQQFSVESLDVTLYPGEYRLVKTLLSSGELFHEVSLAVPFIVE